MSEFLSGNEPMELFAKIDLAKLRNSASPAAQTLLYKAFLLALAAHQGQKRQQGVPYITHPIAVVEILASEFGVLNTEVLAAAFLHDTLEDTSVTLQDLQNFPRRTQELVLLVTDLRPGMSSDERKAHYQQIWQDEDALLLKVADRLSNLADSLSTKPSFRRKYIMRTNNEMLYSGSPLQQHPHAWKLLQEAVNRCEKSLELSLN